MGATISMNELDPDEVTSAGSINSETADIDMVPRSLAACSTLTGELTKVFFSDELPEARTPRAALTQV